MKIKMIMIGILILLLLIPDILAASITIDIKESFDMGEIISFNYTITSETSEEIQYMASIECPNAPLPFAEIEQEVTPITKTYTYFTVHELIEPQTCTAFVSVFEPYELTEEKIFEIITSPSFSFNIILDKKIFIKNENIQIDYTSEISNPIITATLIYPNKKTQQLILPTSIKAEQIGTYELEIIASKEGYKTITKKIQFGIIKSEASIKSGFYEQGLFKENKYLIYFLIGIVVLFILIFLIIYLFSGRKKKGKIIS